MNFSNCAATDLNILLKSPQTGMDWAAFSVLLWGKEALLAPVKQKFWLEAEYAGLKSNQWLSGRASSEI